MKSDLSWDDLMLFAAVARTGSLSSAAPLVGSSPATLSRRLKALEAQIGRRLFLHGAQGYALTADGRDLLSRAERMEQAAADIAAWRKAETGPVRVRISAGTWTARHLAHGLTEYWSPEAQWVPEFVLAHRDMDLARREIDIGIRNRRPTHPWLAGRQTSDVTYGVYAKSHEITGWIAAIDDATVIPSAAWVKRHHGAEIVTTANDPRVMLDLALAGVGRIVLPTFAGDSAEGLIRLAGPIEELTRAEWLVCHHDARHDRPIRAALEALAGYLRGSRSPAPEAP